MRVHTYTHACTHAYIPLLKAKLTRSSRQSRKLPRPSWQLPTCSALISSASRSILLPDRSCYRPMTKSRGNVETFPSLLVCWVSSLRRASGERKERKKRKGKKKKKKEPFRVRNRRGMSLLLLLLLLLPSYEIEAKKESIRYEMEGIRLSDEIIPLYTHVTLYL